MAGTIAAAALAIAAVLSCVVYVARQVEDVIPSITSLIKSVIDARSEIVAHYRRSLRPEDQDAARTAVVVERVEEAPVVERIPLA
ncbi:hypothetical protein [Kitasatospora sp. NPDC050543]|uniref:hypothetical protein n=1 Tax=Kitasatospora sp. NPDC050543 TaxID=3364054 RepID=UPI0037BD0AD2